LRGLSRQDLHSELVKSPLGQALSAELQRFAQRAPQSVLSYYTRPLTVSPQSVKGLRDFWHGTKRLPPTIEPLPQTLVSGIPVKKQGEFPAFWHRENSFIEAMETLYKQVRTKSQL
nr:hypothetical protein [Tatlockia sp.]